MSRHDEPVDQATLRLAADRTWRQHEPVDADRTYNASNSYAFFGVLTSKKVYEQNE